VNVMPILCHLDAAGRRTSSMLTNRCCPRASGTLAMRRTPAIRRGGRLPRRGDAPRVRPLHADVMRADSQHELHGRRYSLPIVVVLNKRNSTFCRSRKGYFFLTLSRYILNASAPSA
jgi:hypothetical protein